MNFCWCTITTGKLSESIAFYTGLVGLKECARMSPPGREIVFLADEKGNEIELISHGDTPQTTQKQGISIGFTVDSLDDALALAANMGIAVIGESVALPTVRFAFVVDPNGVTIQFVENLNG